MTYNIPVSLSGKIPLGIAATESVFVHARTEAEAIRKTFKLFPSSIRVTIKAEEVREL